MLQGIVPWIKTNKSLFIAVFLLVLVFAKFPVQPATAHHPTNLVVHTTTIHCLLGPLTLQYQGTSFSAASPLFQGHQFRARPGTLEPRYDPQSKSYWLSAGHYDLQ